MAKIQIEDINIFESFGASIYNRNYFVKINHVSSVDVATEDSLIFLTGNLKKRLESQLGKIEIQFNYLKNLPIEKNGKIKAVISNL